MARNTYPFAAPVARDPLQAVVRELHSLVVNLNAEVAVVVLLVGFRTSLAKFDVHLTIADSVLGLRIHRLRFRVGSRELHEVDHRGTTRVSTNLSVLNSELF